MLMALVYLLLGFLVLAVLALLLVLVTPLHLGLQASVHGAAKFDLRMSLLAGLIPIRFRKDDASTKTRPRRPKAEQAGLPWRSKRGIRLDSKVLNALPRMVRDLVSRVNIDKFDLDLGFGTGDPASTGRIYGQLMPLVYAFPSCKASLTVRPDFSRRYLEGRLEAACHFTPVLLLWPVLRVLAPAVLRRS